MDEQSYLAGSRATATKMLDLCCDELGYDNLVARSAKWIPEREAAIASLRKICGEFGDNDWEPDLHLADIIDNHLGRYLRSSE